MIINIELNWSELIEYTEENVKRTSTWCGVYAIFSANKKLLYVGKALTIKERLKQHIKQKSDNIYGYKDMFAYFKYAETTDLANARASEIFLINNKPYPFINSVDLISHDDIITEIRRTPYSLRQEFCNDYNEFDFDLYNMGSEMDVLKLKTANIANIKPDIADAIAKMSL